MTSTTIPFAGEDAYIITGGKPLRGEVSVSGAKNIALKVISAALQFSGPVVLENIPRIRDVQELLTMIQSLGGTASFTSQNTVTVDGSTLSGHTLDFLMASRIRASFMLFAPLLHTFGEAHIPNPGGCRLGARPIDRIVSGMEAIGIEVDYDSATGMFHSSMKQPAKGTYRFEKPSHTGTELLIMIAAQSPETTIIENAALEPEIDDLIHFLNLGGAKIERKPDQSIVVTGREKLSLEAPYRIQSDRNEAVTFAIMALATKGEILVKDFAVAQLAEFHAALKQCGVEVQSISNTQVRYCYTKPLQAIDLETGPHPGFMTDWQPPMAVLLTTAQGKSTIHERMFENRFAYVGELHKLGAEIQYSKDVVENPEAYYEFAFEENQIYEQKIEIHGVDKLHNGVVTITDLRAGATLAIGALMAEGESVVQGASKLERGYENFVEKVQALGGTIRAV